MRPWHAAILSAAALVGGIMVGATMASSRHGISAVTWPTEYTSTEKSSPEEIVDFTRAMEIKLRIVDYDTFMRERSVTNAIGFTHIEAKPCEIVLPEGRMIIVTPRYKMARWADSSDGSNLAHEIMHCVRGAWHP